MTRKLKDYLGWYGVLAILLAYALVSFDIILPKSYWYQLLNASGAVGLIIEALSKKDYQPVVLNIVWALIALFSLVSLIISAG